MKSVDQRLKDERKFHNKMFSSHEYHEREGADKFYQLSQNSVYDLEQETHESPQNRRILEYGCGVGSKLLELDKQGAATFGIDISDYAIEQMSAMAKSKGANTQYQVMNAEDLTFTDNSFDIIYGSGILHHLDLSKSFDTIRKKLKVDGKAVFLEPLGHNPLINAFRNRTPQLRTEDEHPLLVNDFKLASLYFNTIDIKYYYLTALILPVLFGKKVPNVLVKIFNGIDKVIFMVLPFMKRFAWQILLKLESPIK